MTPSLAELWSWAAREAESLRTHYGEPLQLHSEHGDRDGWGKTFSRCADEGMAGSSDVLRGLPFTRRFEAYLDGRTGSHEPVIQALAYLRPIAGDSEDRHLQYLVAKYAVAGFKPREIILRLREKHRRRRTTQEAFARAALNGLSGLYFKAEALYRTERVAA